jgi:pimeloyl-ACP methyl ester carboxylesterase
MTDEQIEKTKSLSSEKSENQMRQAWLDIIGPCYNYNCQLIQGFPNLKWNFETYQKSSAELWKLVDSGGVDKLLLSIAIPVTAFHGDDDPIPLTETFEFLRAKIPHCKLIVIPKAGHNIWAEPEAQNYFLGLLKQELN